VHIGKLLIEAGAQLNPERCGVLCCSQIQQKNKRIPPESLGWKIARATWKMSFLTLVCLLAACAIALTQLAIEQHTALMAFYDAVGA
jgi:hypothetical protein